MLFSRPPTFLDYATAAGIGIGLTAVAVLLYFVVRRFLHKIAEKTQTQLDDLIIKALEWPIFAVGLAVGAYLGIVSLPFAPGPDFQIRQAFHAAYIVLGGWTVYSLLDALFRWFKLEITPRTHTSLDDWIVGVLRFVTPLFTIIVVTVSCLELYGVDTSPVRDWLLQQGSQIGLVLLITVVALAALEIAGSKAISHIVASSAAGQSEEEIKKRVSTLTGVVITGGQVFFIAIAAFIILSEFVNITPILAGASVVGVALAFGAQWLVKDLIAGFFIVMENQYRVGDVVKIADISGVVVDINLRRTILRDLDGVVHSVPNGEIKVASNMTKEYSSINLNISVSYGTDLDQAIEVINRVCKEMAEEPEWSSIITKVPQVLRVDKLGDSGIDLKIVGNTKPMQQWAVAGEIRKRVKKAFDKEGIEIPWPHTKVYFGNSPFQGKQDQPPGD